MKRERNRTQPSHQDLWRTKEVEPNLLNSIHEEREKQKPNFSSGSLERERSRIQPSRQHPWREREIESNLLIWIYEYRKVKPNLLKSIHGK